MIEVSTHTGAFFNFKEREVESMKKVNYTQACEPNNIDLAFVSVYFNENRNEQQPLASCRATFKNGLEIRDVAIWESSKSGQAYVSMPTKTYEAKDAQGNVETKRFPQAIFARDRNKQELFNNLVLDAYSKQLEVKRNNELSSVPTQSVTAATSAAKSEQNAFQTQDNARVKR